MRGHDPSKLSASGSDASEAEEVSEERRYRVRVCLQRFFSDERARCYVWVSSSRRVRWLTRRLQRMFALPSALALLSRGHLLPPTEPLALLAPDDPIDVIPVADDRYAGEKNYSHEVDLGGGDELDSALEPAPAKRPRHAAPSLGEPEHAGASTERDPLLEMKRHALRLLDNVSGVPAAASSPPASPAASPAAPEARARRRRVRRRRAPRASASRSPQSPQAQHPAPLVCRNAGAESRSPRAVRALADGSDLGER